MTNIVALDLELNQANNNPKIIEIGLTVAHLPSRKIIDSKSILVNPNEALVERITVLTGITDYMLCDAPAIGEAYEQMIAFLTPYNVHPMPIVWGNGDVWALKSELGKRDNWPFGFREMDVKTLVQAHRIATGQGVQGGLAKSMTRYNLQFQGTKHRARDDSLNTMKMYFHMLDIMRKL